MQNRNILAATLGGSFRCCMCFKDHTKADLRIRSVYRCYRRLCRRVFGKFDFLDRFTGTMRAGSWFPHVYNSLRGEKDRFLSEENFDLTKHVALLAFPLESDAVKELEKRYEEWIRLQNIQEVELIENTLELKSLEFDSSARGWINWSRLRINGKAELRISGNFCLLLMKKENLAKLLEDLGFSMRVIDIEWKSYREPAKILMEPKTKAKEGGEDKNQFLSVETGLVSVPAEIKSVKEAEEFLSRRV